MSTRPKDVRDEILEEFDDICTRLNIEYVLYAGTLLSIVRDGKHLDDEELDVDVMLANSSDHKRLDNALFKAGYRREDSLPVNYHYYKKGVLLDVYHIPLDHHLINVTPYLKHLGTVTHRGRIYHTPFPVEDFLTVKYGSTWRIRIKGKKDPW